MDPKTPVLANPKETASDPITVQADLLALYVAIGAVLAALNKLNADLAMQPANPSPPPAK